MSGGELAPVPSELQERPSGEVGKVPTPPPEPAPAHALDRNPPPGDGTRLAIVSIVAAAAVALHALGSAQEILADPELLGVLLGQAAGDGAAAGELDVAALVEKASGELPTPPSVAVTCSLLAVVAITALGGDEAVIQLGLAAIQAFLTWWTTKRAT